MDVPERVSRAFGKRGYVPVEGELQGHKIRATLVPIGGGRHRLYINGDMRKRAGVDTGYAVRIAVSLDRASREIPVPRDVKNALHKTSGAMDAFEALTPSHRKEFLVWVLDAKKEATRKRRVHRGIKHILAHRKRRKKKG